MRTETAVPVLICFGVLFTRLGLRWRTAMPVPQDPNMEALHEEFLFNYLPSNFPKEFSELCLLLDKNTDPPLGKNKDLLREVQLNLGEIIWRHHKRFTEDKDYFVRIQQCIWSAESVTKTLGEFVDLFMRMDNAHREVTLCVANRIAPRLFPDQKLGEFLGRITTFVTMMEVIAAAVSSGTGIPGAKRGRGRPQSPYLSPAYELMQEWEFITAEPMTAGEALIHVTPPNDLTPAERRALRRDHRPSNLLRIKPVPTPRPLGKGKDKDQKARYVEHSTAFIGLCLKMIKPDITNSEVITSTKHAVKQRAIAAQTVENIRAGMNPILARIEAVVAARK
jgi:hypothetical protein